VYIDNNLKKKEKKRKEKRTSPRVGIEHVFPCTVDDPN
jgi:hypothetical protein